MSKTLAIQYQETSSGSRNETRTTRSFMAAYSVPDDVVTYKPKKMLSVSSFLHEGIDDNYSTSFDIQPVVFEADGDMVFALIAEYSTGDSFRRDDNGRYDIVSIWKTQKSGVWDAHAKLKSLNKSETPFNIRIDIALEDGSILPYNPPWLGHFESLTSLRVVPLIVMHPQLASFQEWCEKRGDKK